MSLEEQIAQTVDPTLFTRLCNSLFTAEHGHFYQVIDGTRGDEGNDGWLETERRIFAIYCPLKPERRKDDDYRNKANADLKKAALLRENDRYPVECWTFVTPRKLSNDVIVDIRKRSGELANVGWAKRSVPTRTRKELHGGHVTAKGSPLGGRFAHPA